MTFVLSLVMAYLLGSISCAIIAARLFDLPNPRAHGSGNPGATNTLRSGHKLAALFVLIGDMLKGLVAVSLGQHFHVEGTALGFIALAAVVGHVFPLYYQFRGGKGVATALGSLFGLSVGVALCSCVTWIVVALLTRYSSLAALVMAIASPLYLIIAGYTYYAFPVALIALLIVWKHKSNIHHLRKGSESKIRF